MNTKNTAKLILEKKAAEAKPKAYEAPRITRKQSLERVTLASGLFGPGQSFG